MSFVRRIKSISSSPAVRALLVAAGVSALATTASWLLPESWVATSIGAIFLGSTWLLTLRDRRSEPSDFGLAFGGILDSPPKPWRHTLRAATVAIAWATLLAVLAFPAFAVGFARFWHTRHVQWVAPDNMLDAVLGQVVVIALPEEVFYRGYLQSALDKVWSGRLDVFGAPMGYSVLVASAVFALGHFSTIPHPSRLAVFLPSIVFGWLRVRTGGVGAGIAFHAACNLLSAGLGRGAGLHQ